jgi:hypothetical protein
MVARHHQLGQWKRIEKLFGLLEFGLPPALREIAADDEQVGLCGDDGRA